MIIIKRLIKKSEKIGNDWVAYHGMSSKYLDDVLKNGRYPSGEFGDYVYLAADENIASAYASIDDKYVILTVKLTPNNLEEIKNNNDEFPYDKFFIQNFTQKYPDIAKDVFKTDDIDKTDIYDVSTEIELIYGPDRLKEIEDSIFEDYFYEAELMISEIKPNQIIGVYKNYKE